MNRNEATDQAQENPDPANRRNGSIENGIESAERSAVDDDSVPVFEGWLPPPLLPRLGPQATRVDESVGKCRRHAIRPNKIGNTRRRPRRDPLRGWEPEPRKEVSGKKRLESIGRLAGPARGWDFG